MLVYIQNHRTPEEHEDPIIDTDWIEANVTLTNVYFLRHKYAQREKLYKIMYRFTLTTLILNATSSRWHFGQQTNLPIALFPMFALRHCMWAPFIQPHHSPLVWLRLALRPKQFSPITLRVMRAEAGSITDSQTHVEVYTYRGMQSLHRTVEDYHISVRLLQRLR